LLSVSVSTVRRSHHIFIYLSPVCLAHLRLSLLISLSLSLIKYTHLYLLSPSLVPHIQKKSNWLATHDALPTAWSPEQLTQQLETARESNVPGYKYIQQREREVVYHWRRRWERIRGARVSQLGYTERRGMTERRGRWGKKGMSEGGAGVVGGQEKGGQECRVQSGGNQKSTERVKKFWKWTQK
jgi:hypothetical protein